MDFKPKKLDEVAGQEKIKEVMRTLIKYASMTGTVVPHCLFLGGSGLGKSSIANVLASEIGKKLHTINCPQVGKVKEIYSVLDAVQTGDIVLFEEIHALPRKLADALLIALEDFYYTENGHRVAISKFTAIGATTDEGLLVPALRNRFKFRAQFQEYTEDELIDISYLVASRMGFKLNRSIAQKISKVSRGIPREVAQTTEFVRMYMISEQLKSIKMDKFYEIVALRGINPDGLRDHDIKYLKLLLQDNLSLATLSAKLGIDKVTVEKDMEPYLLRLGLVDIGNGGRSLTRDGKEYVKALGD